MKASREVPIRPLHKHLCKGRFFVSDPLQGRGRQKVSRHMQDTEVLTVTQLIRKLRKCPPNAIVLFGGRKMLLERKVDPILDAIVGSSVETLHVYGDDMAVPIQRVIRDRDLDHDGVQVVVLAFDVDSHLRPSIV